MTISELIEQLATLPPFADVVVCEKKNGAAMDLYPVIDATTGEGRDRFGDKCRVFQPDPTKHVKLRRVALLKFRRSED